MANNLKRSIAMLLVLNMLTGMIPAQALADEGDAGVVAAVVVHSETSSKEASSSSESSSSESSSSESSSSESSSSESSSSESSSSESSSSESSSSESSSSESSSSESSSSESSSSESSSSESSSSESSSSESSSSESSTEGGEPVPTSETSEGGEPAPASMDEPIYESQLNTEGGNIEVTKGDIETTVTTDGDGNTVTTESQTTTTEGTIEIEGGTATIEGEETYTETITTTPEGEVVGEIWEIEGEETIDLVTKEDTGDGEQPDVTVEIIPGETTTGSAVIESTITGDIKTGEGDTDYDYTITTETERTVTVEAGEVETTVNDSETGLVGEQETNIKGIEPVYDEMDGDAVDAAGKEDVFDRNYLSSKILDYVNINGVHIWVDKGSKTIVDVVKPEGTELPESDMLQDVNVGASVTHWYPSSNSFAKKLFPEGTTYDGGVKMNDINNWYEDGELIVTVPEGGDFRYVGTGEHSKFYNAYVTVIYKKDEVTGETIYDENGEPVIESIQKSNGTIVTIDGVPATELPDDVSLVPVFDTYNGSRPTTFMLMNKDGDRTYAYCCDIVTGAVSLNWYSIANLEDSDYYASEESEEHIRSIVMNGYWGTSDMPKEDGSYEFGSLEKIKSDLKQAIADGKMLDEVEIPAVDSEGKPVVDEAGNPVMETKSMTELIDGLTAGEALLATQSAIWSYSNGHYGVKNGKDGVVVIDPDGYMWNHDPTLNSKAGEALDDCGSARVDFLYKWLLALDTEEESTVVINDKNFVDDMSITIHDKAEGYEANEDDYQDNDVYNTDLNFTLAFIPGENDDLLVQITYGTDDDKQTIVKRLAGENGEGQDYDDVEIGKDGSYVIKNLQLSENQDWGFDLRLEGTQYLENGVYVYQAVGGRDVSQTFVGVAEGERNVDVSVGMTIKFEVDENNHVVAERKWHNEKDPQRTPPPTVEYRLTQGVGQLEIIDEEVPLAEPPQTGDISMLWFAMIMMSGLGLCMLNLLEKKREEA